MPNTSTNTSSSTELLAPRQAARFLGLSVSTLAKLRRPSTDRQGPIYSKLGGSIRYRLCDLDAWVQANAQAPRQPNELNRAANLQNGLEG